MLDWMNWSRKKKKPCFDTFKETRNSILLPQLHEWTLELHSTWHQHQGMAMIQWSMSKQPSDHSILSSLLSVLYKQLVSWISTGKVEDPFEEFLIRNGQVQPEKIPQLLTPRTVKGLMQIGDMMRIYVKPCGYLDEYGKTYYYLFGKNVKY